MDQVGAGEGGLPAPSTPPATCSTEVHAHGRRDSAHTRLSGHPTRVSRTEHVRVCVERGRGEDVLGGNRSLTGDFSEEGTAATTVARFRKRSSKTASTQSCAFPCEETLDGRGELGRVRTLRGQTRESPSLSETQHCPTPTLRSRVNET